MRTRWIPSVALVVSVLSLTALGARAHADDAVDLDPHTRVGPPITYKNLTVFPLVAAGKGATAEADKDFLVLDDGMDRGLVAVREVTDGGSVNQLVVDNKSTQPLFLMSGEMILGGKQDRIIGKDTIIPPKTKADVDVFCVEHGRWTDGKVEFKSAKAMAHETLRDQANFEGQGEVWDEVSKKNDKRDVKNETQTYRDVATGKKTAGSVAPYEEFFAAALAKAPDHDRIVGFAIAVDGKIVGIERFQSHKLYGKLSAKLLRSYYVEAVDAPVRKDAPTAKPADVTTFSKEAREEGVERAVVLDGKAGKTEHLKSKKVLGTSVYDAEPTKADPAAPPPAAVYESVHAAH